MVARRLVGAQSGGAAGRLGGDEFAVLIAGAIPAGDDAYPSESRGGS